MLVKRHLSLKDTLTLHVGKMKLREEKAIANIDPIQTKLAAVQAPAITINKRGAITRMNKEMELLTKYTKTELIGRKFLSLIDTTDRIEYIKSHEIDEADNVEIWPDKISLKIADGTTANVLIISGFIKTYGDNLDEQLLIFKKMTGEVEFATRGMDIVFSKVLNSLDEMIFVLNRELEITHYNSKFFLFAKRLGITEYQLSHPIYEISKFSKIGAVNMYEELFRTNNETTQMRRYGTDKESLYMYFHFIPLVTNGVTTQIVTIMRDITETEELRQKNRDISEDPTVSSAKFRKIT